MAVTKKKATVIPTIDCNLVVVVTGDDSTGQQLAVDTASKVGIQTQTETTEAIKLVKLGKLLAQKGAVVTITGTQITLTDNVFTPELVKVLQGGTLSGTGTAMTYTPPVAGSTDKGEVFKLQLYSAVYDESGQIKMYEVTTFPNCQGTPIAFDREDDTFSVAEYTINSAPKKGEAPYTISYATALPTGFTA